MVGNNLQQLRIILGSCLLIVCVGTLTILLTGIKPLQYIGNPIGNPPTEDEGSRLGHFQFAVIGDTQTSGGTARQILTHIRKSTKAKFIIIVGDMVSLNVAPDYIYFLDTVNSRGNIPVYVLPGNHEYMTPEGSPEINYFTRLFGPKEYQFAYGNSFFLIMDNAHERFTTDQLDRIEQTLSKVHKKYDHLFIFFHVPLFYVDKRPQLPSFNIKRLETIAKKYRITAFFGGHTHTYHAEKRAKSHHIITGGGGGKLANEQSYHHYTLVEIKENTFSYKPVPVTGYSRITTLLEYGFRVGLRINLAFTMLIFIELAIWIILALILSKHALSAIGRFAWLPLVCEGGILVGSLLIPTWSPVHNDLILKMAWIFLIFGEVIYLFSQQAKAVNQQYIELARFLIWIGLVALAGIAWLILPVALAHTLIHMPIRQLRKDKKLSIDKKSKLQLWYIIQPLWIIIAVCSVVFIRPLLF